MKRLILNIAIAISLIGSAYAQQPASPQEAGEMLASQIGMLVIQNASLNQQIRTQQAQIAQLRKQLADVKGEAPAAKPNEEAK
jgi:hypothetical protein